MKNTFRNVLTVCVVAILALAMVSCATTVKKDVNKVAGSLSGKTVILHSNDVHGAMEGYAKMVQLRTVYENQGATVITVDDGDFSQGTLYVSLSKGANGVKMMNAAGYDVVGLGNHEFDYGYDQLAKNLEEAKFQVVCSDVFKDGQPLFNPDTIIKVGGLKVAFFGLETPETMTKVNPSKVVGIEFASSDSTVPHEYELYDVAQAEIDKLSKKADVVICLAHLGVDVESLDKGCGSYDVWNNTKGIDFIIDGHSHTTMERGVNNEPIQSTGTEFNNIGVIVIDNKTKKIVNNYLVAADKIGLDASVLDIAKAIKSEVDTEYNQKFAVSEVDLNGAKAPGNRTMETNNGNIITDSMIWSVMQGGDLAVPADHVVALTNGGGIRAAIKKGDVTKADVNKVLPFGNTIAVIYVKGSELLEALEVSTFSTPGAIGGFPQVSGIQFTIDTSKPYDKGDLYPKSTYYSPKSIQRVTINSINGKAFNPDDTYAVISNNFVAAGGDTYYVFKAASDRGNGFDTAIALDYALMDYITEELGGVIPASKYGQAQGRIIVK